MFFQAPPSGTLFILTGIDCSGKRFRKESHDGFYLWCHNVWRGSLWMVRPGEKRRKIKSWLN